jgi:hypothetical protein
MTDPTPLDITNIPQLRSLVTEMRASKKPRLLKQDRESVALLMPLETTRKQHASATQEDIWTDYDAGKVQAALAASVGTLAGIKKENLLADILSQRTQESTRHQF